MPRAARLSGMHNSETITDRYGKVAFTILGE